MNARSMSLFPDEGGQYTNFPPRDSSPADPTDSNRALFSPPRNESQFTLHRMDCPTGHDARITPSGISNDLFLNRPSHIPITLALLRQNALEQARHEAVLAELAAAICRTPPQHPLLQPLSQHGRDIHPNEQQQAFLQQLLWRHTSSSVPPVVSHAVPAFSGSNNRFILEYLALQLQQTQAAASHLGTRSSPAELERSLPLMNDMIRENQVHLSPVSSYLLSSIRRHSHNVTIAPEEQASNHVPVPLHTAMTRTAEVPSAYHRRPSHRHATTPSALSLPLCLARPSDIHKLTAYQCLLRQQMEFFAATTLDVETFVRGRNRPITLGQVGIRCRHCAHQHRRQKGATYFPATNYRIYQAAQNMAIFHLPICKELSAVVKETLLDLKAASSSGGAGRQYWSHSAAQLGLVDTEDRGIRFVRDLPEATVSDE